VKKSYMKQLDGLRAFAVIFTMVTHFTLSREGLLALIPWGWMGVRLFFVLSGFLITGILLRTRPEEGRAGALRIFYCRRFLRIFPIYYATVFLTTLVNIRPMRQTFFWHLLYLSNIYGAYLQPAASPSSHFWSLAVEEQFYLIWPCLMFFLPRRWLLKAMIAAVAIGPATRLIGTLIHLEPSGIGPLAFFDTLGMGAILAYLWEYGSADAVRKLSRVSLWIGLPLTVLLFTAYSEKAQWLGMQWLTFPVLFDLALAFLFTWLVSAAAQSIRGPAGWLLEWKPVNYLGRISYGVYVLHAFMPVVLFYVLKWTHFPLSNHGLVRFLVLAAMSIAAAAFSWHFLESPINRLKRYFEYQRPREEQTPAEAEQPVFANPFQDASVN
jgi:peptidoglycan/LPS O-acetylase OafA/YrhL